MKKFLPAIGILILAASLAMLLAVMCDYFDVYVPGVVWLIPEDRRPLPSPAASLPAVETPVKEQVVVIDSTGPTPSPSGEIPSPSPSPTE